MNLNVNKKLFGVLRSWDVLRAFGFVHVTDANRNVRKYFLHLSKIASGTPNIGSGVYFDVGTPAKPGDFPPALNAEIGEVLPKFRRQIELNEGATR